MTLDGFSIGHTDRMAIAAVDILRADNLLMQWTGGEIHRTAITGPIPGVRPPSIAVAVLSDDTQFATSSRDELQTPIGFYVTWLAAQKKLSTEEPSAGAIIDHMKRVLMNRYYLQVERYGNERLIERLNTFRLVDYTDDRQRDQTNLAEVLLVADYRSDVNAQTRERWSA